MDMRPFLSILMAELLVSGLLMQPAAFAQNTTTSTSGTVTPIQHLVVIFDENISFDRYSRQ
jgi:phospholipase C